MSNNIWQLIQTVQDELDDTCKRLLLTESKEETAEVTRLQAKRDQWVAKLIRYRKEAETQAYFVSQQFRMRVCARCHWIDRSSGHCNRCEYWIFRDATHEEINQLQHDMHKSTQ